MTQGYDYLQTGQFQLAAQGKISSGNGAELARAFLPPTHAASMATQRGPITESFRNAIMQSDGNPIISSEFFTAIPNGLKAQLVLAFADLGEITMVFFTREQINFLASAYTQEVKRSGLQQFPDEYFAQWEGYKAPMMYYSYLSNLADTVPGVEILAQPYELSRSHPNGLMGMFLDMLGISIDPAVLSPDVHVNLSPSPKEIRLMIEINKHRPRMEFSDMLVESSLRAGRTQIHSRHSILPLAFRQEARAFFRQENENYFREIVKSDNIYETFGQNDTYVDLREIELLPDDLIHIFSGLLVDLDQRLARLENKA